MQDDFVNPSETVYYSLLKKLKDRLQDGRNETIFDIGIGEGRFGLMFYLNI